MRVIVSAQLLRNTIGKVSFPVGTYVRVVVKDNEMRITHENGYDESVLGTNLPVHSEFDGLINAHSFNRLGAALTMLRYDFPATISFEGSNIVATLWM